MNIKFEKWKDSVRKEARDPIKYKKILGLCIYGVLAIISIVMTVMNIITDKGFLTWATALFALLSVANLVLSFLDLYGLASALLAVEIVGLFTFFLISGNPEGFSAIWIVMFPSLGMMFYDRKRASIICGLMFLLLIFFLWTPWGHEALIHPEFYTDSFRMRFPVAFLAFFVLAFFLETLRLVSISELQRLNRLHEEMSVHDQLTGVYNRQGMYNALQTQRPEEDCREVGVIIFDIDFFKRVNDTYGHAAGDEILKQFAGLIKACLPSIICRWGGEEFSAIWYGDDINRDELEDFRRRVENHTFTFEDERIAMTVSAGVYVEKNDVDIKNVNKWIRRADIALYVAKDTGRNKVVYYDDLSDAEKKV